jgi:4-carboxymuconolactone decarboxylase
VSRRRELSGELTERDTSSLESKEKRKVPTRIPPVIPGTRSELAAIEAAIRAERGSIPLLYQVLLNSPHVAEGWEKMLTAVRNRSSLPASLREMVIIRVAVLNRAPYELEAHRPVALASGVSEAKIDALRLPQPGVAFTALERAVLALTDAMTREVQIDDVLFEPLRAHFDPRSIVDLVATIAAYNMVSRFLEALRIGH